MGRNRPDVVPAAPLRQMTVRRRRKAESACQRRRISCKVSQGRAHFLCRAKEAILCGLLGRAEDFANGTQSHALVVPHLKNHSFPWREFVQHRLNAASKLLTEQLA